MIHLCKEFKIVKGLSEGVLTCYCCDQCGQILIAQVEVEGKKVNV